MLKTLILGIGGQDGFFLSHYMAAIDSKLWMNWQKLSGSPHSLYELNHAIQSFDEGNRRLVDRLFVGSAWSQCPGTHP